jgi:hypothetical protein
MTVLLDGLLSRLLSCLLSCQVDVIAQRDPVWSGGRVRLCSIAAAPCASGLLPFEAIVQRHRTEGQ